MRAPLSDGRQSVVPAGPKVTVWIGLVAPTRRAGLYAQLTTPLNASSPGSISSGVAPRQGHGSVWTNFVISSGARRGTPDETEARSRARRLAWWSTRGFSARERFARWFARS